MSDVARAETGRTDGTRPVRVGVVGCEDIAVRRMLPALAACPDTEPTAVASRDASRARTTARPYGCAAVTGYHALLERDDIDAVYVPLPLSLHAEWARRALLAGKHVLVEKPLTSRYDRTERLLALAGERSLVLAENIMFPHHPAYTAVEELLADGVIGAPRALTAVFTVPPRPVGDIRYRADLEGGALFDMGVYPLRLAMELLGPDLHVSSAVLRHDRSSGVDVGGAALMVRASDGVAAQVTFGMEHEYTARWELLGSRGRLSLDRAYSPPPGHRPLLRLERAGEVEERILPAHDQAVAALAAFARAVRSPQSGEQDRAARSLRQALLIDAVREAAEVVHV